MSEKTIAHSEDIQKVLRNLSSKDFMSFGLHQISYIKVEQTGEKTQYGVYAADGEQLDLVESKKEAINSSRYQDLEPVIIH